MKKAAKVMGITMLIFAVIATGGFLYIKNMDLPEISIGEVNPQSITDGSYIGEYTEWPVSVAVTVTVKDKMIQGINIDKHQNGLGKKAEAIVNDIIDKQSLDINTVSGATLSSNVICKAVERALMAESVGIKK